MGSILGIIFLVVTFRAMLKIFGEPALAVIPAFQTLLYIPVLSLIIGVAGWWYRVTHVLD